MKRRFFNRERIENIDNTLKKISLNNGTPKILFVAILVLYALTSVFVTRSAYSQNLITVFGHKFPAAAFTGVYSALANICIIFLVVFFGMPGYITSLSILVLQFPILMVNLLLRHNPNSIPGLFTNLFTFVAITLLYINNRRIERYQERLREQAVTDSLTGLPNRFACNELCNKFIKKGERFAVVSIDLKNFKSINDTMGHDAGDLMLKEIARRWKNLADSHITGTIDFVSRLAGDEFALLIRGYNSCLEIINTINIYEAELERKITIDDCDYFVTAFFGYAEFPDDTDNSNTLFACADAALHEIKRLDGNNKILRFYPELLKTEKNLEIERTLRSALETNSILFYLQPQYNSEHKLRGFEALARLKDANGAFIRPDVFIPVAEKAGLIDRVDLQVFKKAAAFLNTVLEKSNNALDLTICINVSVRHLMKNNFIDELKDVLKSSGVSASHFEIEITESIMIDSYQKAFNCIKEVKQLGFKVAIDDFGTGYSSLSYLQSFPANLLKIDKSFIDVMNSSDASKKYVATIISIGHILNLEVISEGVESPEQLETLKSIGCDYIQGYIWGRPMSPEDAEKLIVA